MTRTAAREMSVQLVYEGSFHDAGAAQMLDEHLCAECFERLREEDELFAQAPDERQEQYIRQVVSGVGAHIPELDSYIERYAKGWKFSRISRIALAIMRVAMYEVLYMPEVPPKAAINEAVELAKKYESSETVAFINGILGSFIRGEVQGVE